MTWKPDGVNTGNSHPFAQFRCDVCARTMTTCGAEPDRPCVCTTRQQPKRRNMSGLKGKR